MTAPIPIKLAPVLQRARGILNITASRAPKDITRLKDLHQQASYRAIFPKTTGTSVEAVIINTAGGVTGGDKFSTSITAYEKAQISITTQAAERIYRSADEKAGTIKTTLYAESSAQLYWLPQETILFDGARLERRFDVNLHRNAKFLMVEPLVFGRRDSGETLTTGLLDDLISIRIDGKRSYLDRIKLEGKINKMLNRAALGSKAGAMASIILIDLHAKALLKSVRGLLPSNGGASLLTDTILVMRILSTDSYQMRSTLVPILNLLTDNAIPKNWRL